MTTKQKIFEYTVTGSGYFPYDMLRYDRAWPINTPLMLSKRGEYREILINGIDTPTINRWASFGWTVEMV